MVEKFLSSVVGASIAKAVTVGTACANGVVCYLAKMSLDAHTRQYFMAISAALLLVMLTSFAIVGKRFFAMMRDDAQNGVHFAA